MVRLVCYLGFVSIAVLEGGFLAGLAAFLSIFLPTALNGYILFGLMYGFALAIPFVGIGLAIGLGLGLISEIVSLLFFQKPLSNEIFYRFVLGTIALLVTCPIAYILLKYALQSMSATEETSLDIFSWPVIVAMLIGLFISQRFASRYIKFLSEKAKNSDLI